MNGSPKPSVVQFRNFPLCKTPQAGREFRSDATKPGLPCQKLEFCVKAIDEGIGLQFAVVSDVAPDFGDIVLGAWAKKNDRHL